MIGKDGVPDGFRRHLCNECVDVVLVEKLCPHCVADFEQSDDHFPITVYTPEQAREINRQEAAGSSFVRSILDQ